MNDLDRYQSLTSMTFEEIIRLVNELAERISAGSHLAAVSTLQALIGRASDLGELCGAQVNADATAQPQEEFDPAGYL